MKYLVSLVAPAALLCVSAACWSAQPSKIYSGTYFYNFESSSFTPDGSNDIWCLSGNMEQAELPAKTPSGPWGTAHVVVRGQLSPPGHYCNLGASKYILKVYKLIRVSGKKAEEQ